MIRSCLIILGINFIIGCSMMSTIVSPIKSQGAQTSEDIFGPGIEASQWQEESETHKNLSSLPKAKGKIIVSTYGFKDMSGQYKPSPSSTFSTAVSQGANAILIKALKDSNWFIPIEREGLQNLLTERKIIRAGLKGSNKGIPPLTGANILLEGGIIGYDTNVKSGGAGAKYFGLGASEQYRVDQVTVSLRAIDISNGKIINTVVASKSVFSQETRAGFFRFVKFKRLLELEAGYTRNEPGQLALVDAIETAVLRMITTGLLDNLWSLDDPKDFLHPVIERYSDPDKWNNRVTAVKAWLQRIEREKKQKSTEKKSARSGDGNKPNGTKAQAGGGTHKARQEKEKPSLASPSPTRATNTTNPAKINKPVSSTANPSSNTTTKSDPVLNDQHDLPFEQVYSVANRNKADQAFYSIQLISSTNSNDLIDFVSTTSASRDAFTYATYTVNGVEKFALLYDFFSNQKAAQDALQTLPPELSKHRPWVRKVSKY